MVKEILYLFVDETKTTCAVSAQWSGVQPYFFWVNVDLFWIFPSIHVFSCRYSLGIEIHFNYIYLCLKFALRYLK